MRKPGVLIVDADASERGRMRRALCEGFDVHEAGGRAVALDAVRSLGPRAVVVDLGPPCAPQETEERLAVLSGALLIDPSAKVLAVNGTNDRKAVLKAVELGAFDVLDRPASSDDMRQAVARAVRMRALQEESARMEEPPCMEGLAGSSPPMLGLYRALRKAAATDAPVLISGESGTGKEEAARAIHRLSARAQGPFSVIDCGAIPGDLIESELFGYEKGAFTGAEGRRKGRIEYAEGGTLLLDEIGELRLDLQVKLLRFLQEKTVERVGSRSPVKVNARVVAATNRDLPGLARAGLFREDLYYRLAVITIAMPPLRERGWDIGQLALRFLKKYAKRPGSASRLDKKAVTALSSYGWPGNVRELENRIRRAAALACGPAITAADLGLEAGETADEATAGLLAAKEEYKKRIVGEALLRNGGKVGKTACELGISRQYLWRLMTRYGVK